MYKNASRFGFITTNLQPDDGCIKSQNM